MTCDILELYANRHSFYDINNILPISEDNVQKIVQSALGLYPSPFNSQSARITLLFGELHKKFWDIVLTTLLSTAPKEKESAIRNKIATFAAGAGTILYYMNTEIIKQQEEKFPLYAVNFKNWGYQCNAILQFMIWSALANQNIGANLQHYNPIIDEKVKTEFNIPDTWELVAQMPFGGITIEPTPHPVIEDAQNVIFFS